MAAKAAVIPSSSGVLVTELEDGTDILPTAFFGWNVLETSGSAKVKLALFDGTDTSGTRLAEIEVDSGEEKTEELAEPVEVVTGSLYLQIVSGACSGEVFWA